MTPSMCPHCGRLFCRGQMGWQGAPGLIPEHAYPATPVGGHLCPGSGQVPRSPESDRRPLWKDDPEAPL